MTDEEVLDLLRLGNEALVEARRLFDEAFQGAESETSRCWAAHMAALLADRPTEKLRLNRLSLDAARAVSDRGEDAASLLPTVLANVGYSQLLMARPDRALQHYEEARRALSDLPEGPRSAAYSTSIDGMINLIRSALLLGS